MSRVPFTAFFAVAGLMLVQAVTGLAFPSLYRDTEAWILAAWRGNDAVTTAAALALIGATWAAKQGSTRALLFALGLLWYGFYNDAYYLLGAALGVAFPLYVLIMVAVSLTLIATVQRLDPSPVVRAFSRRTPVRAIGGVLVVVGALLAAVWTLQWYRYVATGKTIDAGPDAMRLIATMDLTVIVPSMISGGVLLWLRRPWGYVVAALGSVLGATYALVLTASTLVGWRMGLPGMAEQLPLWGALAFVLGVTTAVFLGHVAGGRRAPTSIWS